MLSDSDTNTDIWTKIFWYRFKDFVPLPNFYRYRLRDFFCYQISRILVPIPPGKGKIPGTGTHYKSVPVPNFSDTGSETFSGTIFFWYQFRYHQKMKNIRLREFPVLVCHSPGEISDFKTQPLKALLSPLRIKKWMHEFSQTNEQKNKQDGQGGGMDVYLSYLYSRKNFRPYLGG